MIRRKKTFGEDQIASITGSVICPSTMGKHLTRVLARASPELSGVQWAFLVECLGAAVTSFEDSGGSHYGIWTSQDLEASQEEGNKLVIQSWSSLPITRSLEGRLHLAFSLISGRSSMQALKEQRRQKTRCNHPLS